MIGTSASWPISVRVAVGGFLGVVASVLLLLGHGAALGRAGATSSLALDALQGFAAMVILVPISLTVASPLILIAIVCGVLLKRAIERHLLAWSLAAPVIVWLFVSMMDAVMRRESNVGMAEVPGRLARAMRNGENLLTLFAAAVAGVVFYVLSAKRRKRPEA
ncbi:hypothetical protein [Methylobacterium sp. E-045]|uniref:hypothetical protein n=1 Tax=Methylobacterium sp. E-045 TaxID=2836575 RepID=UPI001FB9D8AA|nr:hypothetical protein [Methylobacterium sp. E-045]MCJ2130269.1 hypothetical protein [Methylobacterium sp. E-045]